MKIYKAKDYDEMSLISANIISSTVTLKPDCVLGLATGSTPLGLYKILVEKYNNGELDFKDVTSFNLDEYVGLSGKHEQSYRYFMDNNLFKHINIDMNNTHVPDGMEADTHKACDEYTQMIKAAGGTDLQLLGLGHNGHIGFNEPDDSFSMDTHCVNLSNSTINANARFFDSIEEVPRQAYTMGVGTIMSAKKILIVVSGADKAEIVSRAFHGPVTPNVPVSILQMHPDVILVADEAALSKWN